MAWSGKKLKRKSNDSRAQRHRLEKLEYMCRAKWNRSTCWHLLQLAFPTHHSTLFHPLMHVYHKQNPTTQQTVANNSFDCKCCKALPFQLWTHRCGGTPQIVLHLPWIATHHVWLWRLRWHAKTTGLHQWSGCASEALSFYLLNRASSACA